MTRPSTSASRLLAGSREPVLVATTANIDLSTGGLLTIDGVTVAAGDRVLVKNQTDATENGIYNASAGEWYRSSDARSSRTIDKGITVHVQSGTTNEGNIYVFQTLNPDIGDDDIDVAFYLSEDTLGDIQDAGDDELAAIAAAGDDELAQIAAAGDAEISQIGSAGEAAFAYVEQAEAFADEAALSAASAAAVSGSYVSLTLSAIEALDTEEVIIATASNPGKEGTFLWDTTDRSTFMEVEALSCTVNSTTDVVTSNFHQLDTGSGVYLKTAVNGLTAYTIYFVIRTSTTAFKLAASFADAKAGTAIDLTASTAMTVYRHADPHGGRFRFKNGSKCDGSEGCWVRQVPDSGEYNAGWWGLDEDWTDNQGIMTTVMHACPDGATVVVPVGTYPVTRYMWMRWRTGQTLKGLNWQSKFEGPDSTTASSIIRVVASYSQVVGMAGGKFKGQVSGEITASDAEITESCGVHVFAMRETYPVGVRVKDCHFYELDTGVEIAALYNKVAPTEEFPINFQYYNNSQTWVESNYLTDIRRQGIELMVSEHTHVHHNTVIMGDPATYTSVRGIRLVGCQHFSVVGNRFYGYSEDHATAVTYGISVEGASMDAAKNPTSVRYGGNGLIADNYTEKFQYHYSVAGCKGPVTVADATAVGDPEPPAPSKTVTISVAVPAVVTWANHLLPVGTEVVFTSTGTLPTGITADTTYYVSEVVTTSTFKISATLGGADVDTTLAGSGTHTCTAPNLAAASRAGSIFMGVDGFGKAGIMGVPNVDKLGSITIADPGVLTWAGNVLVEGDEVKLYTTDTLPTGLTAGTAYYVVNLSGDTFNLAATPGGAAIETTGSESGTHQIIVTRFLPAYKNETHVIIKDCYAYSISTFLAYSGGGHVLSVKDNLHIGNGNQDSTFLSITNTSLAGDPAERERLKFGVIDGNTSICNGFESSAPILITNVFSGTYYSVNRNRCTLSGSNTKIVVESGVTDGTIAMDSPTSNQVLPAALWSANFNPPPDFTHFDVGEYHP